MPIIGGSHKPDNLAYCMYGEAEYELAGSPGGTTSAWQAAGALNVGDAVFISGQAGTAYSITTTAGYSTGYFAPQVNKSATLSNYTASRIGIVVGGDALYKNVAQGPNYVQVLPAATASGQTVYVQTDGVVWVNVDAAVSVGAKLTASATTAGALSTTGAAAGNIIALAMNSTAGAGATLAFINLA